MSNDSDNEDEAILSTFNADDDVFAHQLQADSSCAALLFGSVCYAFILYCIYARTPHYFRSYSRLVLIGATVDAASLLTSWACRTVIVRQRAGAKHAGFEFNCTLARSYLRPPAHDRS